MFNFFQMYDITNAIRNQILNIEELIERILIKLPHLTPTQKTIFRDRILKPNLETFLLSKQM